MLIQFFIKLSSLQNGRGYCFLLWHHNDDDVLYNTLIITLKPLKGDVNNIDYAVTMALVTTCLGDILDSK